MDVFSSQRNCVAIASVLFVITMSAAAHADELQDLKDRVDALHRQVAELERATSAGTAGNAVTGGATKGSFKLPGSDTSITLGGYVKLDAIYSDRSAGVDSTGDQELEPGSIPVGPGAAANDRNQVTLHARQSRLFFKTSTPTNRGDLGTYLEFDLFGASGNESVSNSSNLRLRHAYGTLGGWLFGQTWTTFSDVDAYPETVDFGGTVGQIFARQAQLRWTQPFADGDWSIALENPETVASLPGGAAFRADDDRLPDLTTRIRLNTAAGRYSIAGLVRQVRVDSAANPAARSQKLGAAIGANGIVPIGAKDDLRFSAYLGNVLGRYTAGYFTDGVVTASGQLQLPRQWIAAASYRHFWSPTVRSTLALSKLASEHTSEVAGNVNKNAESAHLNVIWSPFAQTNFGLEYIYARRETQDGQSGQLHRLQAAAQYLF
ncbi:MAG: DcaP family trimeric outer membrane transporter [Gemmatimonadota bacterium]